MPKLSTSFIHSSFRTEAKCLILFRFESNAGYWFIFTQIVYIYIQYAFRFNGMTRSCKCCSVSREMWYCDTGHTYNMAKWHMPTAHYLILSKRIKALLSYINPLYRVPSTTNSVDLLPLGMLIDFSHFSIDASIDISYACGQHHAYQPLWTHILYFVRLRCCCRFDKYK